jgi:hypothetical protein
MLAESEIGLLKLRCEQGSPQKRACSELGQTDQILASNDDNAAIDETRSR